MAGGMTGAVRQQDERGASPLHPENDLRGVGLTVAGAAGGRAQGVADILESRTPGFTLFSVRVDADLTLEHDGVGGMVFVVQNGQASDAQSDAPQALMIVPNGRKARVHWRRGETVTGAAFAMARLRRHVGDRAIAGGVHDLALGDGGGRAAALGRLLAFFTAETSFGLSLLDAPAGLEYVETTLFALLAEGAGRPSPVEAETAPAPRHLRRAEAYVRDHLASDITVEDLVRAAGVSERSLYRAFNDFRGMSIRAYVQNARMDAARRCLLERPDTPLGEVAKQVGYTDYTSFWRHYRSRFGDSPSAAVRSVLGRTQARTIE